MEASNNRPGRATATHDSVELDETRVLGGADRRILNVGCGRQTYGTDFVDKFPQRSDVKMVDLDVDRLPFPDESFDEVYSKNMLEHVASPGLAVREMRRILRKGGVMTIETDHASYWVWTVGKSHHAGYRRADGAQDDDRHYSLFTPEHLVNHALNAGFTDVKFEFVNSGSYPRRIRFVNFLLTHSPVKRFGYRRIRLTAK